MGTKFGKSVGASTNQGTFGLDSPGTMHRWVAPIYEQSEIGMKYMKKILPPYPHVVPNMGKMRLNMPYNEVQFQFWHAKNAYSLEGEAPNSYVIDEAAKQSPDVYPSVKTTITRTKAPIMGISTPLAKNWFYERCMYALEHMEWSLRRGRDPELIFMRAPTHANPTIDRSIIEAARKELPERLFRQYYLAEFLDDSSVFSGFRECVYTEQLEIWGKVQKWTHPEAHKHTVAIGVDWARTTDWTVFIAFDIATARLVGFERFHKIPYTEQIRRLCLFSRQFEQTVVALHDKTGVGVAIDDQLAYTDLPFHGVTFTNALKAEWVAKLITAFEQGLIAIPWWDEMLKELDQYEVKSLGTGAMQYSAPSGRHDDIVSALFLAHAALLEYGDRIVDVRFAEDLVQSDEVEEMLRKDPIAKFYRDALGDDDD